MKVKGVFLNEDTVGKIKISAIKAQPQASLSVAVVGKAEFKCDLGSFGHLPRGLFHRKRADKRTLGKTCGGFFGLLLHCLAVRPGGRYGGAAGGLLGEYVRPAGKFRTVWSAVSIRSGNCGNNNRNYRQCGNDEHERRGEQTLFPASAGAF